VFLILFFVGGFCYVTLGVLYNYKMKGIMGKEAIPNYEFWLELPGLVKDGCFFAFEKIKGLRGDGTWGSTPA